MRQLVNKVLFKYIILLTITLILSIASSIALHFFFQNLSTSLSTQRQNLQTKMDITKLLLYDLFFLHTSLLEAGAATTTKAQREDVVNNAKLLVDSIEKGMDVLTYGGNYTKQISRQNTHTVVLAYEKKQTDNAEEALYDPLKLNLEQINILIEQHAINLNQRDHYFAQNHPDTQQLIKEIRLFNQKFATVFDSLQEQLTEILLQDSIAYKELKQKNNSDEEQYHLFEFIILVMSAFIVLIVMYNIIVQIINLYKELENKLYIDALTKLPNRFALLKELQTAENPALIIIDINAFRTINEIYGVDVGNEVLIVFAKTLSTFGQGQNLTVYRISGDEFVLFKDAKQINHEQCSIVLEYFFKTIVNKKIYIASIEDTIYLDLSAGISFEKDNTLGTADIALNKAKELHQEFAFYDQSLDSISEIKHGTQWKKRIIDGIENDLFLPFFQPIVNRDQEIIKFEALMRLKETLDGKTTYIVPYSFLDIASKTRHYNEISTMVLMKSFALCAQYRTTISVNLNYQDILNTSLHEAMKQAIIADDIGHLLVFEILETENILNYKLIKNFIDDFRTYGVRFAIDDFGTGFSNFSHIFELSPDFIKIDGSLIKNIHNDKKSYELVKAVVFFSKELGIKTIAEFVHCKEVFDIAYKLGIDQFQGYYFAEPSQTLLIS